MLMRVAIGQPPLQLIPTGNLALCAGKWCEIARFRKQFPCGTAAPPRRPYLFCDRSEGSIIESSERQGYRSRTPQGSGSAATACLSRRLLAIVLFVAMVFPLGAASVETQHALDATLPLNPRLELLLHSRIRTQPGGLGFYQVRAGPILSWDATKRIALLGGYYYAQQERRIDRDFIGGHRFFGGAEFAVVEKRRVSFDQRVLVERFQPDAAPDFSRYRLRSRLSAKGAVAPYTSNEFFFDALGWRSNRYSLGIRWSQFKALQIDLGYFYEHRRLEVGPARHMWLTSIHWKKKSRTRKIDADP